MNISQLINYYPKYEYLDNAVSMSGKNKLRLFIDVKGCMQSMYLEWAIKYVLEQSEAGNSIDHSLFSSMLEFISFHKTYASKRKIDLEMYFFLEHGKSSYHKKVHKDYKENRDRTTLFDLDEMRTDLFFKIMKRNLDVIQKVIPRIPDVYCTCLTNVEADFMPYYLREYVLEKEDCADIIYSTDKDMLQCVTDDNCFQFYKHYKKVVMLSNSKIWDHGLKIKDCGLNISNDYFALALAILGDSSDNFKGVNGIGEKTLLKIIPHFPSIVGSMNELYDRIEEGSIEELFIRIDKEDDIVFHDSKLTDDIPKVKLLRDKPNQKIIARNLRLASYEMLSRYINKDYPLDRIKLRNSIKDSVSDENKIKSGKILHAALDRAGMMGIVNENTVYNLFL